VNLPRIMQCAQDANDARQKVTLLERQLWVAVVAHLDSTKSGARELARRLKLSPQYICDIRHGRRKISAEFVERLRKMEKGK
jgi:transcriptional regulator with XRE-family HTH domain